MTERREPPGGGPEDPGGDPPDRPNIGGIEWSKLQLIAKQVARRVISRYGYVKRTYAGEEDNIGLRYLHAMWEQHITGTVIEHPCAYLSKSILNWARKENKKLGPPPGPVALPGGSEDSLRPPFERGLSRWNKGVQRVSTAARPAGKVVDYRAVLLFEARWRMLAEASAQGAPRGQSIELIESEVEWADGSRDWQVSSAVELRAGDVWAEWRRLAAPAPTLPTAADRAASLTALLSDASSGGGVITRELLYTWAKRARDWAMNIRRLDFEELLGDLFERHPKRRRNNPNPPRDPKDGDE